MSHNCKGLKGKQQTGGGGILSMPALGGRGRHISVSSSPAWSTKQVPGQPELLHRETLSGRKKKKKERRKEKLNSNSCNEPADRQQQLLLMEP